MGDDFDEAHRGASRSVGAPFRKALSLRGRPESRLKWYLIWARRFAAYLVRQAASPRNSQQRRGIPYHTRLLARDRSLAGGAGNRCLTILLGSVFGQEWARTIRIPASSSPDVPLPKGDDPVERLRYAIRCRRYDDLYPRSESPGTYGPQPGG